MGTECAFVLPMSSEYCHENRPRPISRATSLIKSFGRSSAPSPNHPYKQNAPSFLVDLNRETSISHHSNQKLSGSSQSDMGHANRMAPTTPAPKGPRPRITRKEGQSPLLRRIASLSNDSPKREKFEVELKPQKSMEDMRNFDRQPQNSTDTGSSDLVLPSQKLVLPSQKPGPPASKITIQLPPRKLSSNSLPEGAPKFRVVGRGGSGSQLRKVSVSSPAVGPDVPLTRQPPKAEFYRPTGRGGSGSSRKPLIRPKSPTSILSLLSGRGRILIQARQNERYKSHKVSPLARTQSLSSNLNHRPTNDSLITTSNCSEVSLDSGLYTHPPSVASPRSEELCSISRKSDRDDYSLTNSSIEEEPIEHRQLNLNKLTRTFGALPAQLMESFQSDQASKSSATFNNLARKYSESLLTNLGNKFGSQRSLNSSVFMDDLHRFDYAGELSKPLGDLDDGSSAEDGTHSPITFAPPSPLKNTPHPLPPPGDLDSDSTTPSRECNSTYSSTEPSLPPPTTTHLCIPSHSTSRSHSLLPCDNPPQGSNGLPSKANWLVPLGRHDDDLVISITRGAPDHAQSWMGEWNNDMKSVIESLRRL